MPDLNLQYILIVFLGVVSVTSLFLFIIEYRSRQKILQHLLEESLAQVDEKSKEVILQAINKSQGILASSEAESSTLISETKQSLHDLEEDYQKQYQQTSQQLEAELRQHLSQTEQQFVNYLNNLQISGEKAQNLVSETLKAQVNQLTERFEQNLTDFFTQTQHKSISSIELELKSARVLIDAYKQKQLSIIDENVIALLERTLSLVLTKKMSLKDQLDLVYEALEQAKIEKFII